MALKTYNWCAALKKYMRFLASQGTALPNYGTLVNWNQFMTVYGNIPPRNLAAFYPNDATALRLDGSNNVILWEDRSGNSATTCYVNGTASAGGAFVPTGASIGVSDFTVIFRFKIPSSNPAAFGGLGYMGPADDTVSGQANQIWLELQTNGAMEIDLCGSSTGNRNTATISNFASTYGGNTVIVFAIVRSASGNIRTYVNGAEVTPTFTTNGTPPTWQGSLTSTYIGIGRDLATNGSIVGDIYSARLYNSALSAAAVLADYNGAFQSGLTVNCDFSIAAKLAASFTCATGQTVTMATNGATSARICGERDLYQGTAANRPAYTAAAGGNVGFATFDGSNDTMRSAAFSLSQPLTVYFVGVAVQNASNTALFSSPGDAMGLFHRSSTSDPVPLGMRFPSSSPATTVINLSVRNLRFVATLLYNVTAWGGALNRGGLFTGVAGNNNASPNGVIVGSYDSTGFSNTTVSEMCVYSEAHNEVTQTNIITALATRNQVSL